MPPDDELTEFFRAVLPEQEPPLPRHFVTDARAAGQRIRTRRRLLTGITALAFCAVVAGAGTALWITDRTDRATTPAAEHDTLDDSAAIGRLAVAVQQNLTHSVRESTTDLVATPPVFMADSRPALWRIELTRSGLRIGWIDITAGLAGAPAKTWQLRCPVEAFADREGSRAPCALPPPPAPGTESRSSGSPVSRESTEVLIVGEETGQHIVLTATGASLSGMIPDGPRHPGETSKTDDIETTETTETTDKNSGAVAPVGSADNGEPGGDISRTGQNGDTVPVGQAGQSTSSPVSFAAPVAAVEMREILRYGDAPAALTALLGIGV